MLYCRSREDILVRLVDQNSVLSFSHFSVVFPTGGILSVTGEVIGRKVVARAQFTSPTCAKGVEDEIACIQVVVRLVTLVHASLHSQEQGVLVSPTASHRCPLIKTVIEEVIQRRAIPERPRDGRIVPEHTPWFGSVGLFTLVQGVVWMVVMLGIQEHGVGRGGKLVRTMITVIEKRCRAVGIHVELAGESKVRVGIEEAIVGSRCSYQ